MSLSVVLSVMLLLCKSKCGLSYAEVQETSMGSVTSISRARLARKRWMIWIKSIEKIRTEETRAGAANIS